MVVQGTHLVRPIIPTSTSINIKDVGHPVVAEWAIRSCRAAEVPQDLHSIGQHYFDVRHGEKRPPNMANPTLPLHPPGCIIQNSKIAPTETSKQLNSRAPQTKGSARSRDNFSNAKPPKELEFYRIAMSNNKPKSGSSKFSCQWGKCAAHFDDCRAFLCHLGQHLPILNPLVGSKGQRQLQDHPSAKRSADTCVSAYCAIPASQRPPGALALSLIAKFDKHLPANLSEYPTTMEERSLTEPETGEDDHIVCGRCNSGCELLDNLIVLCDECDAPYHQLCHQPNIPTFITENTEAPWRCAKCIVDK